MKRLFRAQRRALVTHQADEAAYGLLAWLAAEYAERDRVSTLKRHTGYRRDRRQQQFRHDADAVAGGGKHGGRLRRAAEIDFRHRPPCNKLVVQFAHVWQYAYGVAEYELMAGEVSDVDRIFFWSSFGIFLPCSAAKISSVIIYPSFPLSFILFS